MKVYSRIISHSKPWITKEDIATVKNTLVKKVIAQGELVKKFEDRVAKYNNCAGGLSFSSGTTALFFILKAMSIGKGKEVILPAYVCKSVLEAVLSSGAKPVLCDIGEDSWNMTPDSVRPFITKRTAAIISVHIFGIPADIKRLKELGILIIEDCAQAFGAECEGKKAGSVGDIGFYSFHASKCLTTGKGGMVVVKDVNIFDKLILSRERMRAVLNTISDIEAALGLSQLERYGEFLRARRKIADFYFKNLPAEWTTRLMKLRKGNIFFRFPLYGGFNFEKVAGQLRTKGILIRRGVDSLLRLKNEKFPQAEKVLQNTVSIPIYPSLSIKECKTITDALNTIGTCR